MNKLVCIFFVVLVIEYLSASAAPQNDAPEQKPAEKEDDMTSEPMSQPKSSENEGDIVREGMSDPKSSENADAVRVGGGGSDATGSENVVDNIAAVQEELMFGGKNGSPIDPSNPVASAQSIMSQFKTFLQAFRRVDQLLDVFGRLTGMSSS